MLIISTLNKDYTKSDLLNKTSHTYLEKLISIIIIVLSLIFLIRIGKLEADIPNWDISYYQPADEIEYVLKALKWHNQYDYEQLNIPPELDEHLSDGGNFFINAATAVSFKVFGNNYFGLRMPSIMFAIGTVVFTIIILNKIKDHISPSKEDSLPDYTKTKNDKFLYLAIILTVSYFAFDFTFMLASIVAEPTISRSFYMLFVTVMFLCLSDKPRLCYFMQGMLITLGIILVYVTNIFMFVPVGVSLLFILIKEKDYLHCIGFFIIGTIIGFLIGILIFERTSNGLHFFDSIKILSNLMGDRVQIGIRQIINNIYGFCSGNIFRFNPFIFYLMVNSILINLYFSIKYYNKSSIYILFLLIGFILQCIVTYDYPIRKTCLILPAILINIYTAFLHLNDKKEILKIPIEHKRFFIGFELLLLSAIILFYCKWITAVYNIVSLRQDGLNVIMASLTLLPLASIFAYFLFAIIKPEALKKMRKGIFLWLILLSLIPNLIMQLNYIYLNTTYSEKEIMVEVGDIVGHNYVVGGVAYHYSLYNDIIPVMSGYDGYLGEAFSSKKYSLLFNNDSVDYFLSPRLDDKSGMHIILKQAQCELEPIKTFYRAFSSGGTDQMVLYKIISTKR